MCANTGCYLPSRVKKTNCQGITLRSKEQQIIATDSGHADTPGATPLEFDLGSAPLGALANSASPAIAHEDANGSNNDPAHAAAHSSLRAQDRSFVAQHIAAEQVRLLYRFSLVGYLAELLVTFLLGAILWNATHS